MKKVLQKFPLGLLALLLTLALTQTGCQQRLSSEKKDLLKTEENPSSQEKTTHEAQICSANIQFLGSSKLRNNTALASLFNKNNCDIVVIQELIAPPDFQILQQAPKQWAEIPKKFPNSEDLIFPNERTTDFFQQMKAQGYDHYLLSEEDTGPGKKNHMNSSATEWWVTFYRSDVFEFAADLPHGFLSSTLSQNSHFDRVPYAFPFRSRDGEFDFVLISVHLRPGPGTKDKIRRKEELTEIFNWIEDQQKANNENDYIVLGDMNIENQREYENLSKDIKFKSLNTRAQTNTNTNMTNPKPYDHVFLNPEFTSEITLENNFIVINLIKAMEDQWLLPKNLYPGAPYNHNMFRLFYSDHHPVQFKAQWSRDDD